MMWELIRQNKRKSIILFIVMGIILLALGYVVGAAWMPPDGGLIGVFLALMIWTIWSLVSYFAGDSIILKMSGAKLVTPDIHPQLFNVVEEMKIAASLPALPKVYIIDSEAPNAFAIGRNPENASVAVTAGLLARLNRDELQGVIAHEVSHIQNRDVQFMTFAGIMLGTVTIISHVFLRSLLFRGGSNRRYKSGGKDAGQAQAIIMVVALVFAILAPIMIRLLYFAISRRREYLADASAARLTRYPEGLASALEKISKSKIDLPRANKVTAPMFIINPLKPKGRQIANLSSTHPPITERVKILRAMSHGVGLADYQNAFKQVKGKGSIIPSAELENVENISARKASGKSAAGQSSRSQQREIGDLMRAVNKYLFVACVGCGMQMKIPPDFKKKEFACPRCSTKVQVPLAQMAAASVVLDGIEKSEQLKKSKQQTYKRKSANWESFRCNCGKSLQVSPYFSGTQMTCNSCGNKIKIS